MGESVTLPRDEYAALRALERAASRLVTDRHRHESDDAYGRRLEAAMDATTEAVVALAALRADPGGPRGA